MSSIASPKSSIVESQPFLKKDGHAVAPTTPPFSAISLSASSALFLGELKKERAFACVQATGLSDKEIESIVEDNSLKHGKFLPGMNIPITSKEKIKSKPDYALVLAWNFFDEIKKKNSDLAHKFINIKDLEI